MVDPLRISNEPRSFALLVPEAKTIWQAYAVLSLIVAAKAQLAGASRDGLQLFLSSGKLVPFSLRMLTNEKRAVVLPVLKTWQTAVVWVFPPYIGPPANMSACAAVPIQHKAATAGDQIRITALLPSWFDAR
jgi:hypothetical protein